MGEGRASPRAAGRGNRGAGAGAAAERSVNSGSGRSAGGPAGRIRPPGRARWRSAASFSIIWLNSEYGRRRGGLGGGDTPGRRRKRRCRTRFHQAFADGVAHEIVNERSVPEAHLGLRWMHVDVHLFGVAFEKQQRERIGRGRHQVVIGGGERVQQQAVANQPAVHENVDRIAIGLLHLRAARKSRSAGMCGRAARPAPSGTRPRLRGRHGGRRHEQLLLAIADLHQLLEHLAAEDLVDALLDASGPASRAAARPGRW